MTAYYNEIDPYSAQWLRNLIAAGHVAPGDVDERSIEDICPDDLRPYTQCHFFAGIGIWSYALRRNGWADDRPIWTGSCPCQPFSSAGKNGGFADERHLWPAWFHLISQLNPAIVLGEQVASKDGLGWVDLVSTDMEGAGYAFGASDLCAAGFSGTHIRQRLYLVGVADAAHVGFDRGGNAGASGRAQYPDSGSNVRLADTYGGEREQQSRWSGLPELQREAHGAAGIEQRSVDIDTGNVRLADAGSAASPPGPVGGEAQQRQRGGAPDRDCSATGNVEYPNQPGQHERPPSGEQPVRDQRDQGLAVRDPGAIDGHWRNVDWLLCRNPTGEPSWRPVEPGSFPLAHASPARMGRLRAYGNGLDAETATGFIAAVMDCLP
jgi:DNA (cytosine-5)-methyltransferase 1